MAVDSKISIDGELLFEHFVLLN